MSKMADCTGRIERIGYGAAFNDIYIVGDTIIKASKNEYGNKKIKNEMLFYKYLKSNNICLPVPKIISYNETAYTMEYLKGYVPLYTTFNSFNLEKKTAILDSIYKTLTSMHDATTWCVNKAVFFDSIFYECRDKILERYDEIHMIIGKYSYIKRVNGVYITHLKELTERICQKIREYFKDATEFSFCLIHGDCQFNNILYNPLTTDIVFIDPRGSYGNNILYGLRDYDYAKVKFALSGYDIFDNMNVESLNIDGDNLILDDLFQIPRVFEENNLSSILALSIWLGNAHCFKHNVLKTVYSYFYAVYLAGLYL